MFEINRHILNNGLEVLHVKMPSSAMAVVNILYKVGSRNESPELTGFAHLFEHLMFGGSENIPEYDTPLQRAGGDNNAWTSSDITNFYDILPASNLETAFWLESDRMQRLAFTPSSLEVQRSVVIEEFKERVLNTPLGGADHKMREMAFKVHPYRWPVIGLKPEHIEKAEMYQVKEFFYSHYAPGNAVLSVVGNVEFAEVVRLAEKWFAPIEARHTVAQKIEQEPRQTDARHACVEKDIPVRMVKRGYKMPGRLSPDYVACDILSDVLSNGSSSRLYQNLVMRDRLFSSVDASIWGSYDPGLFTFSGVLMPEVSYEEGCAAFDSEINAILTSGIAHEELEKCVNKWEATEEFANINASEVASKLCYHSFLGDAEGINNEINSYRALTTEVLEDAARRILKIENSSTLFFGPQS